MRNSFSSPRVAGSLMDFFVGHLSKFPSGGGVDAKIRNHLQAGVRNAHRQVGTDLRAQLATPREIQLRAKIHYCLRRVIVGNTSEGVLTLVSPEVMTWGGQCALFYRATDRHPDRPTRSNRWRIDVENRLRCGWRIAYCRKRKNPFPAHGKASADNAVDGTGTQGRCHGHQYHPAARCQGGSACWNRRWAA